MDQRKVVGIRNICANRASMPPASALQAGRPPGPQQAIELRLHARRILDRAIAASGTTFRDYRTGTGEPGNFQLQLWVYGREGEPCRRCGTTLTGTHEIDARVTVFCHRCQS
jgi:formamidopyrimidine-DNA glycosylase